jgi:hypothetical protein
MKRVWKLWSVFCFVSSTNVINLVHKIRFDYIQNPNVATTMFEVFEATLIIFSYKRAMWVLWKKCMSLISLKKKEVVWRRERLTLPVLTRVSVGFSCYQALITCSSLEEFFFGLFPQLKTHTQIVFSNQCLESHG